jgi:hypothetical protein
VPERQFARGTTDDRGAIVVVAAFGEPVSQGHRALVDLLVLGNEVTLIRGAKAIQQSDPRIDAFLLRWKFTGVSRIQEIPAVDIRDKLQPLVALAQ